MPVAGRYAVIWPYVGTKSRTGSSVVMRHCIANPRSTMSPCGGTPLSGAPIAAPPAMRICALTRSMPVTASVTVCSTWMRGLTSMK